MKRWMLGLRGVVQRDPGCGASSPPTPVTPQRGDISRSSPSILEVVGRSYSYLWQYA
jgi:hypothetical protein